MFSTLVCELFFFKQKAAYEMRISDWSSDVCSSDLEARLDRTRRPCCRNETGGKKIDRAPLALPRPDCARRPVLAKAARKSVVSGKSVSVRVALGGRRLIKKTDEANEPIPAYQPDIQDPIQILLTDRATVPTK